MRQRTGLDRLLAPRRIALIGATSRPAGLGARTLRHLLDGGYSGAVSAASSVAELAGELADQRENGLDIAVVAVPAGVAPGVVAQASQLAAYVIVYSSGFEEVGAPALRRAPGAARIIGPNSVGLYYAPTRTTLTFAAAFDGPLDEAAASGPAGGSGIFLVSQSGAFGARLLQAARRYGVGFDGFVGSGNETDYGACDLAADLIASPAYRPRVVALYLESVRDGAALRAMLCSAAQHQVSVVLLLGGESDSGARAARSHTAAVSPDHAVVAAMCGLYGAVLVASDRELAEAAIGLSLLGRARGPRVAVLTGSGGAGVVAADILARRGVAVPPLSMTLRDRLAARLPSYAATANPVDVTAQTIGDTGTLAAVCADLAESGEVDCLLVVGRAEQAASVSQAAGECVPAIVCALDGDPSSVSPSLRAGLAVLPGLEAACNVARAVTVSGPLGRGGVVIAMEAMAETGTRAVSVNGSASGRPPDLAAGGDPDTASSLRLVSGAGVAVAPWRLVSSAADAARAGAALGWPVVLKANLPAAAHKALRRGVRLDVGPSEVEAAAAQLLELAPDLVVARQLRGAPELLAGVRRDPLAGLTVVAGLGGGQVELIGRTVSVPATAPAGWLAHRLAIEVFDRGGSRYAALPVLLAEAAGVLAAFAAHYDLSLVECNPLVLVDDRLVALDARVITHD